MALAVQKYLFLVFLLNIFLVNCDDGKESDGIKIYKRLIPADVLRGNNSYKSSKVWEQSVKVNLFYCLKKFLIFIITYKQ